MGLAFAIGSHESKEQVGSMPYSSFMELRAAICEQAGLGNIYEYKGYANTISAKNRGQRKTDSPKEFDQSHLLTPLLNHSDCDGEMSPAECRKTLEGLDKQLVEAVCNIRGLGYEMNTLLKALKKAVEQNERLIFC